MTLDLITSMIALLSQHGPVIFGFLVICLMWLVQQKDIKAARKSWQSTISGIEDIQKLAREDHARERSHWESTVALIAKNNQDAIRQMIDVVDNNTRLLSEIKGMLSK